MRDDLHRTVGVSRHWKKVLRYLPREVDRLGKLPVAMVQAVRAEISSEIDKSWAGQLKRALSSCEGDFFKAEQVNSVVDQFESKATSVAERDLCEFVRGEFVRNPESNWFDAAFDCLVKSHANQKIEQVVATVRQDTDVGQASAVRRRLEEARNNCDFASQPEPKRKSRIPKASDVFDFLDRPVEIKGGI